MRYGLMMHWSSLLWVVALPAAVTAQRVPEGPEPNASTLTATTLACGAEALGFLSGAGDEDWFEVVLSSSATLHLTTAPGPTANCRDTVVTLLDHTGGPLRQSDDAVGAASFSELVAPDLAAGTYFVAVSSGALAVPGSYVMDVACVPSGAPSPGGLVVEGPENNDPLTGGVATNTFAPFRASGALQTTGAAGDWDFWRMLLFGEQVVRIRLAATSTISSGAAEDPVVAIYDAATPPNLVAGPFYASDRGVWDQDVSLRLGGGVHQVAVRGVDGSQPGAYLMDVTVAPSASGVVFSGGCNGRSLSLATSSVGGGPPRVLERPRLGGTYTVDGSGLGSLGYCFYAVGTQPQSLSLTPLGAPGCALEVVPIDVQFRFADSAGAASWSLSIPSTTVVVGTQLHSQVAVLDLSNALGLTTSNRVLGVVGH